MLPAVYLEDEIDIFFHSMSASSPLTLMANKFMELFFAQNHPFSSKRAPSLHSPQECHQHREFWPRPWYPISIDMIFKQLVHVRVATPVYAQTMRPSNPSCSEHLVGACAQNECFLYIDFRHVRLEEGRRKR